MKKGLFLAALLFLASSSFAQYSGNMKSNISNKTGGYTAMKQVTTVEQAKNSRDDTRVMLEGKIIEHIAKDKYLFIDNTGNITIEIDHDDWRGVVVGPNDTVVIYGEVDKDFKKIKIDVDYIEKK